MKYSAVKLLLTFLLLLLLSCKKDKDPVDPDIRFEQPVENEIFNVLDTIHVAASISCSEPLTGLKVTLVDENLLPVLAVYPISLNTTLINTWTISQDIPIDAISLKSGNYFIWIQANTSYTFKNKYLPVRLIEVKKKLKKILILLRTNVSTISLYEIDTALQLHHLHDFPQDLGYAAADHAEQVLYLAGSRLGILTAFDLDSNKVLWQKQGLSSAELPYYQQLKIEDELLFTSSSDGKIIAYDVSGKINFYKDFGFIDYPTHSCLSGNLMITAVSQKSGYNQYLNNYYYPGGAYQAGIQTACKAVNLFPVSKSKILLAANQGLSGVLCYYYPAGPAIETACSFPAIEIKGVVAAGTDNYLINTSQQVYRFQKGSDMLTLFLTLDQLVSMDFDVTSDWVVIGKHNKVGIYSFPQAAFQQEITVPDSLKACLVLYNR